MAERFAQPDTRRLSILTATILLVYALSQFIRQPAGQLPIQLPGFFVQINLNVRNLVWIGVAVLAGAGMNWLLADHPRLNSIDRVQHWLIPGLTAWVIGVPLFTLPVGPIWWVIFAFGGLLLSMVFIAEYYVLDPSGTRTGPAMVGLISLSYALFLILAAGIHFSGARLYLVVPAISISAGLVALRALYLRSAGKWMVGWAVAVALTCGQIIIGLHYLPLSSTQTGLIMAGILYAAVSVADRASHRPFTSTDLIEPGLAIVITALMSFILQ